MRPFSIEPADDGAGEEEEALDSGCQKDCWLCAMS